MSLFTSRPRALAAAYQGLAQALAAGLPSPQALRLAAGSQDRFGLGAAAALTARGERIAVALGVTQVPADHRRALAAAEQAGRLPDCLRRLSRDVDAAASDLNALWASLAYPLLVLHLIVPALSTSLLLTDPGRFLLRVVLATFTLWGLLGGAILLHQRLRRRPGYVRALAAVPALGTPLKVAAQMRFLRALEQLYGAGVHFKEAVAGAHAALGAAPPTDDFALAATLAHRGEPMDRVLAALTSLAPLDRSELVTGATVGELESALRRVLERLEELFRTTTRRLAVAAGRLLYIVAFGAVVAAVVSFYSGYLAQFERPLH